MKRKDVTSKVVDLMQELSASLQLPALKEQLAARDKRIAELETDNKELRLQVEHYGAFNGGDPRAFEPDPECSTEVERKRWVEACERAEADANACMLDPSHTIHFSENGQVIHTETAAFGLGMNRWKPGNWREVLETINANPRRAP